MSLTVMDVFYNTQRPTALNIESIKIFPMKLPCMHFFFYQNLVQFTYLRVGL